MYIKESVKRRRESTFSEDDGNIASVGCDDQKKFMKQNHSEIEKRRRDKMNNFITELSKMIPSCMAMSKVRLKVLYHIFKLTICCLQKTDKLTILRLAVQHIRAIHSSNSIDSYSPVNYKPSFLSDTELKNLLVPNCDGFLFVVDTARGRILFVSESVRHVLHFTPEELTGQSLFDILHHKDICKVKEQLANIEMNTRDRLVDSRTMLPITEELNINTMSCRLHPGARRMFLCRMKCKQVARIITFYQYRNPIISNFRGYP